MDEGELDKLWERIAKWTSRALKAAAGAGILLCEIYFIRIRSVPLDNLSGIAGIGTLIALLSFVVFISMAILWGFPGLAVRIGTQMSPDEVRRWFVAPEAWRRGPKASSTRLAAWGLAYVASPWVVLFCRFVPDAFGGDRASEVIQVVVEVLAAFTVGGYILDRPSYPGRRDIRRGHLEGAVLRIVLSAFVLGCFFLPMFLFLQLVGLSDWEQVRGNLATLAVVLAGTAFVTFANVMTLAHEIAVARSGGRHDLAGVAIAGGLLAALIGVLGAWGSILDRTMVLATVRVPHATVLLREPGCAPLRMAGLLAAQSATPPPAVPASQATTSCALRDVTLLSRLGARWPAQCDTGTASSLRIELRADDVAAIVTGETQEMALAPVDVASLCRQKPPAKAASQ